MLKILLSGASGQMGNVISQIVEEKDDLEIVCGFAKENYKTNFPVYTSLNDVKEKVDVLIDFSGAGVLDSIINYAKENNIPLVLASTGYTEEQESKIYDLSENLPILYSRNMSLGVNVMESISEKMASMLSDFDIEIIEKHHNLKKDSPSGTAKMLFEAVNKGRNNTLKELDGRSGFYDGRPKNEVGISSIRAGNIVGEHTIIFAGEDEVIELTHKASSKKIFANGALKAASFIVNEQSGLYTMQDVL